MPPCLLTGHNLQFIEASHGENVWECAECHALITEYQNGDGG